MAADVVAIRGGPIPVPDDAEPCPVLIATLDLALEQARAGEITAFIMVVEHAPDHPKGPHGSVFYTDCAMNLANLLAGLRVEEHLMVRYLADQTLLVSLPPKPLDDGA